MLRALKLAEKGRGTTSPNPMVGALVTKSGRIIAEDYHKRPGDLHAEALTLLKAGGKAKGATLYVTLEPCCHKDKRTPPCAAAIITAGIKKVFIAMKDPNPKVSGKGIEELKRHGIEVVVGVLAERAARLNEAYVKYITTGLPFVTLKVAMTLDGKIATPEGRSKWITGEEARRAVHRMRSDADALLTAIGTVRADNPSLTARIRSGRNPKRVIIDPGLETPLDFNVCCVPPETILVTRRAGGEGGPPIPAREEKKRQLREKGVSLIEYEGDRVDLGWLMRVLGEREVSSVLIEGGSSLNASALQDGIVDKVVFFVAPKIIGGRDSLPAVGGTAFRQLEEAYMIHAMKVKRAGQDLIIEGYVGCRRAL
ncbi:MAG: bifunctional diaminohydroxyphosphoribosylaminopyrimidine deaminase/5-amino-6-(5-phosphoribosylamino)uracil reductase RibD [Nitrospirales bacterium]|nr:bifunctional diaminohydroxyphosphoribosylaminopyrimidine deaminase/5-amino-6-(5-phosphoribosylamino)uracil reductase RibD [Nitrospirales bacterium]